LLGIDELLLLNDLLLPRLKEMQKKWALGDIARWVTLASKHLPTKF
jgi:hypothetical protein